jgi:predicted component of type VI protein secretion system
VSSALLGQILGELDPENLPKALSSSLKFGALRKAELYDIYSEKFAKMKRWHESGQYLERLLRDFEKRCRQEIANGKIT